MTVLFHVFQSNLPKFNVYSLSCFYMCEYFYSSVLLFSIDEVILCMLHNIVLFSFDGNLGGCWGLELSLPSLPNWFGSESVEN